MKFLFEKQQYADGIVRDNGWWRISGDRLYNRCGGSHDYVPHDDDIICEANDWDELDYSYLLKPESKYGWIDRNGRFYGCNYEEHDDIAELVLHKSSRQLETEGWIKIYASFTHDIEAYIDDKWRRLITPEQIQTLSDKGLHESYAYRSYRLGKI